MRTHALAHKAVPKPNTSFEKTPIHIKAVSTAHASSSGSSSGIMRTVIALVIVVAVIYALTWIVRKLKTKDAPVGAGGDGLERIAALPLGTNKSVALVRVGNELHLLGIGDQVVTGIRTFSEDEALELGLPVAAPGVRTRGSGQNVSFIDTLKAAGNREQPTGAFDSLRRLTQR